MKELASDARTIRRASPRDFAVRGGLLNAMSEAPIPREELLNHLVLFQDRRAISRILFLDEIYRRIVGVHGSLFEFGVRYGPNLALLCSLRGIHEPLNANRKIVGFDTFAGFPGVAKGRDADGVKRGDYAVPDRYEEYLKRLLALHEAMGPLENLRRFELVKGDAARTVTTYLKAHPETIIALAYFDLDLYRPTKACLKAILPYLTKGAIVAFDEVNAAEFPGETLALREVLGQGRFRLIHSPFRAAAAYLIYE